MTMQLRAGLALMFLAAAAMAPASAREADKRRAAPITVEYAATANPTFQAIRATLQEARALERIRDHFARLRLPKPLRLKLDGCDGDINAWYEAEDGTITVCYEYLAYIGELRARLPAALIAQGLSPQDAVIGPFLEVFLHETAHALFDLLKIPVLGREEDAADQVAAYVLLHMGKAQARKAIAGVAFMYASEAKEAAPEMKDYADVHGVSAQRFFNLLCMAYGKDPAGFGDVVAKGLLPNDRAEGCAEEYAQVARAYRKLIAPHVARR